MAKPDCATCAAMGWAACDRCGNPVMKASEIGAALGVDLCVYCVADEEEARRNG